MPHGNFDTALTLNDDGTLTVCGPLFWSGTTPTDLPATELDIELIVITQRTWSGRHVIGKASPHATFTPAGSTENEWMLDVEDVGGDDDDRGGFEAGPAQALAIVRVREVGRARIAGETWNESVHLS
jgi:hypothetical protein